MHSQGHEDPSTPPTVTRLRTRVRSLRDQLARSLDARERAIELSERHAAHLEAALRTNSELRTELATAYTDLAKARDELATERAEHAATRDRLEAMAS